MFIGEGEITFYGIFDILSAFFYGKETLPDGRGTALMFAMILIVLCWFGWPHHRAL
jgi:hypothetical protein